MSVSSTVDKQETEKEREVGEEEGDKLYDGEKAWSSIIY
jgi:hypothetical protein